MAKLRGDAPDCIAGFKVTSIADYQRSADTNLATGEKTPITLPKSDVLSYRLENGAMVIIRPSGTEPKIKAYITAKADTNEAADTMTEVIQTAVQAMLV